MMSTRAALTAALWTMVVATQAVASEQSKLLYSRGLVEVHAENDAKALELFDAAVEADPSDVVARYYRGVARGRQGDLEGAIADFEAALARRSGFPRASLELGAALLRVERFPEAAERFAEARVDPELEAKATLFEGIARLRLGDLDAARELFEQARADEGQRQAVTFYEGVAAYQNGRMIEARGLLERVVAFGDGPMAVEAQALLDQMEPPAPALDLRASAGFQYDSNVLLAPSDGEVLDDLLVSDEGDGSAIFAASARWVPVRTDTGRVQVGYDFFQSIHFDLEEFDIQSHGLGGDIAGSHEWFDWGAYGWYDFHTLDGDKFLSRLTFLPWFGISPLPRLRTELSARLRNDDFYGDEFGVRDASNGSFGVRQFAYLTPDRFAWVGYRREIVDSTSDDVASKRFEFKAHEVEAGIYWQALEGATFEAEYRYRSERYDSASQLRFDGGSGLLARREDDVHRGRAALRIRLSEHWAILQGVAVTDSRSSQDPFAYDRIVGTVALEARY